MEFGLLYDLRNPRAWEIPAADLYAETLDHIQAAEALGFPLVWLTEHHFIDDGYLPSVLTMAAAVAARTSRVTIGTNVLLLPLHHPLRVAEDAAVVDALSRGRLRLGLGLGYKLEEFGAFQVGRRTRAGRMEEGIQILRGAWGPGPFSFEGRHYRFRDVDVTPKPPQGASLPIWLAGRTEAPVRRAAQYADGLIAVGSPELWEMYRKARAEFRRTGPLNLAAFAPSWPSPDPGGAWEAMGAHVRYRGQHYGRWYGAAGDLPSDRAWLARIEAGDDLGAAQRTFRAPPDVIQEVRASAAAGVTSLVYFATFPGLRPSATLPLLECLAKEVMPHVR
jgi:alkanesulfonate monooxygenase SsuD/methylene tetrahydromethanopterin reductase-like flavin-dependent oxidoreductase (luciferase family)